MPLPEIPTQDTGAPNPVEALPAPVGEARGAAVASGFESSLGVSLETQAIGKAAGGTQFVPYDDAKSIMEKNGYDPNVLPSAGLSNTELNAIMNQQSAIKRNDAIVQQSSLSKFSGGALRMLGGAGDPIFIAAGPILGRLGFAVKGMGIGGRLAAGAAEGGALNAGYDVALKKFGTAPGDADIGTQQIVTDALVGGLVGGSLHGLFGPRPQPSDFPAAVAKVLQTEGGTTTDTGGLTKFGISANTHPGVDIANLTQSHATEIYKSQYWDAINADKLSPEMRMTAFDAAVNQGVGKTKQMLKEAKGNPAAFNALREAEYRRLAASDPQKYGPYLQGWLNRLKGIGADVGHETMRPVQEPPAGEGQPPVQGVQPGEYGDLASERAPEAAGNAGSDQVTAAYSHAYAAAAADAVPDISSEYRTNPFRIADEHADEVTRIEGEAMQRVVAGGGERDTRGGETYFHGTSRPIENLVDYPGNSESNIYGHGLYTTDAADIARGYSKKGGGAARSIYQVSKTGRENLVDMEAQMPPDVAAIIKRAAEHDDLVGLAIDTKENGGDGAKTLREVYDSIRANSAGEGVPKWGVQEIFDSLSHELMKEGYTGLKHIGGQITGKAAHKVEIHWEPQTRGITLSPRPDLVEQAPRAIVRPGTIEPGSVFTRDPAAKAILSQPPPERVGASPTAEFADLAQSAADAVHEAEQAHALTGAAKLEEAGAETPLHTELASAEDAAHAEGYSPDMVKAIHAAVRCAMVKGLG